MIVYGDSSHLVPSATLKDALRLRIAETRRAPTLDALRTLLIEAGQFEQAILDASIGDAAPFEALTDAVAEAFVACFSSDPPFSLDPVTAALERLPSPNAELTVKPPEGFAYYALYPEGYVLAARRWARGKEREPVRVVGVRSIGTTLSAVVAATLRADGVPVRRTTVRPGGHPFDRQATLSPDILGDARWALVVDEGPGLSGSSMASVAEALVRAGLAPERIAFLSGHGGEPGAQASESIRAWWAAAPRFVVPTEALRWEGLTLEETLAHRTGGAMSVVELTGGRWRELVYDDPNEWPSVVMAFERRKLLVRREDGTAVLWKFVGLTVPGTALGFAPSPWIDGEPLRREDATPDLLAQIGRRLAAVVGPPRSAAEAVAAWGRLEAMLRLNAAEAGLSPQPPLQDEPLGEGEPSAGDYRLAPWEWRRLPGGEIVKAGRIAPTLDHTVVGRQPLAWDVAGAMVEWGLDDPAGLPDVPDLRFYCAAYAAFRMGQCTMFAGSDAEGERLRRDAAFYRAALERALDPR